MVAGLERGNRRPDALNDADALMTEYPAGPGRSGHHP